MTNAIIEYIVSRSATKKYDPAVTLSDDQIRELVRTPLIANHHPRPILSLSDFLTRG